MNGIKRKYVVSVLLAVVLMLVGMLSEVKVSAAEVEVYTEKCVLGVNGREQISVYTENANVTISFASKDEEIAKVDEDGFVTALAPGKTKIIVTQELDGKKSVVSKVSIKVKKAKLYKDMCEGMKFTSQPGYYEREDLYWETYVMEAETIQAGWDENYEPLFKVAYYAIEHMNPEATYKFISSDENLLKIAEDGKVLSAQGEGTVKITVKETYNGKTRKVGSYTVEVVKPHLTYDEVTYQVGDYFYMSDMMEQVDHYYLFTSDEVIEEWKNIDTEDMDTVCERLEFVQDDAGNWYGELVCAKEGTAYLYVFACDYNTGLYNDGYLGGIKVNITVADAE